MGDTHGHGNWSRRRRAATVVGVLAFIYLTATFISVVESFDGVYAWLTGTAAVLIGLCLLATYRRR